MMFVHIIILFCLSILLFSIYLVAKELNKEELLGQNDVFFQKWIFQLEKHLVKKNVRLSAKNYIIGSILSLLIVGGLFYVLTEDSLFAVLFGVMGLGFPELIVQIYSSQSERNFEKNYASSLEQLSSSLRAGMSISQAVEDVANCKFLNSAMQKRWAKLSAELQMGVSVSEAFHRFAHDTENMDALDVAIAIDVQDEVGGHESEVIEEISINIKNRILLRRELKSIFSGTSSMIWIMDVIGPGVLISFLFTNKDYIDIFLETTLNTILLIVVVIMMFIGSIINHKLLKKAMKGE